MSIPRFADALISIRSEDPQQPNIEDMTLERAKYFSLPSTIYSVTLSKEALEYYMLSKLFASGWPKPNIEEPYRGYSDQLELDGYVLYGCWAQMFVSNLDSGYDPLLK